MNYYILVGNVLEKLAELPDQFVHCVVTSPPYWGLRDYGVAGQIGLEATIEEHIAKLVEVFREVRRVLRDDGTIWVNYGNIYNKKQLLMLPARLALALQADGWWLRSEIVWAKGVSFCPTWSGSVMPESVKDRPTTAHEKVFLLAKQMKYYYDQEAVREEGVFPAGTRAAKGSKKRRAEFGVNARPAEYATYSGTRNLRNVWTINPEPFPDAHFATFPRALVRPCIRAGTSEKGVCSECGAPWKRIVDIEGKRGKSWHDHRQDKVRGQRGAQCPDNYRRITKGWEPTCEHEDDPVPAVVLDPFTGSGTTGVVCAEEGRDFIGIELNPEYAEMARKRLKKAYAQ